MCEFSRGFFFSFRKSLFIFFHWLYSGFGCCLFIYSNKSGPNVPKIVLELRVQKPVSDHVCDNKRNINDGLIKNFSSWFLIYSCFRPPHTHTAQSCLFDNIVKLVGTHGWIIPVTRIHYPHYQLAMIHSRGSSKGYLHFMCYRLNFVDFSFLCVCVYLFLINENIPEIYVDCFFFNSNINLICTRQLKCATFGGEPLRYTQTQRCHSLWQRQIVGSTNRKNEFCLGEIKSAASTEKSTSFVEFVSFLPK